MSEEKTIRKRAVNWGLLTSITALLSSHTAYYLFPANFTVIAWSTIFGIFLAFFRFGSTKKQQIFFVSLYTFLTWALLLVLSLVSVLPEPYYSLFRALIIFVSLCTHRYFYGSRKPSIFLVVYLLIFFLLSPHAPLQEILTLFMNLSMGLLIPYFLICPLIAVLPVSSIPVLPPDKKSYLIKQALRITITLNIAFFISALVNIVNTSWVCFSILVISEANIGSSVRKALERLSGTLLGGLAGIILANLLFQQYTYTLYICFVFIFFTYYYIGRSYTVGIALATVLVTASFYMLAPHMNINQFVLARILDTTVGIILGLLGEMLIFPNSAMHLIRTNFSQIFGGLHDIIQHLCKKSSRSDVNEVISREDELFSELKINIKTIKHEPIVYLSKRSGYVNGIYTTVLCFYKDFKKLVQLYEPSEHEPAEFHSLSQAMLILQSLTLKTKPIELQPYVVNLCAIVTQLKDEDMDPQRFILIRIFENALKILQLYQKALSIPYWLPKWKSIPMLSDDEDA